MADKLPENLQEIVDTFQEVTPRDRLDLLLEFAESMPDLAPELAAMRDSMEQVHECQSPVFLRTRMEEGRIFYDLDVPREAPTVRGFASILYEGLNGTTPEAIESVPLDLYEQLGLNEVLSSQRVRGMTALLSYMKRSAQRVAQAA